MQGRARNCESIGAIALLILSAISTGSVRGDEPDRLDAPGVIAGRDVWRDATDAARSATAWLFEWYVRTPPQNRVIWGGLAACAGLAIAVFLDRGVRLRGRKVVPPKFGVQFLDRLHNGKLECGEALDFCELNPSPAARVALAAVRRWGRPAADLERAVTLAHKVESERLRRNVGTLRRIAALAPLLGLLGTLFTLETFLRDGPVQMSAAWGPALADALTSLTTGIVIGTLAMVAYDSLATRIESLSGALDRLGAQTIDAIALTAPAATPTIAINRTASSKIEAIEPRPTARMLHPSPMRQDPAAQPLHSPHHPTDI
jgi:biopolymer transport protein ExbB